MLALQKIMFLESTPYTVVLVLASALVGLFAGSLCYRMAWNLSHDCPTLARRTCPSCGHAYTLRESLPLLSWLLQRGVCPQCGTLQGGAYVVSALLGSGIFSSVTLRHGVSLQTLEILALSLPLLVAATSSLMDYRIPNSCMGLAVLIRIAYLCLTMLGGAGSEVAIASIFGAAALGIPLLLAVWLSNALLARDVTGIGTVKLVTVVGLCLGWQQGIICLGGALALGLAILIVSPAKRLSVEVEGGPIEPDEQGVIELPSPRDLRASLDEDIAEPMRLIPFAPSIIIALWVMLLLGVLPATWSTPLF